MNYWFVSDVISSLDSYFGITLLAAKLQFLLTQNVDKSSVISDVKNTYFQRV